jgi:hypothetical protein
MTVAPDLHEYAEYFACVLLVAVTALNPDAAQQPFEKLRPLQDGLCKLWPQLHINATQQQGTAQHSNAQHSAD